MKIDLDLDMPDMPDMDTTEPTHIGLECDITMLAMRLGRWLIVIPPVLDDALELWEELERLFDLKALKDGRELWKLWSSPTGTSSQI